MNRLTRLVAVAALLGLAACSPDAPDPDDEDVVSQREEATQAVKALVPSAADLGQPVGVAGRDVCGRGSREWNVREPAFACAVNMMWLTPGASTERDVAAAIETQIAWLDDAECRPAAGTAGLEEAQGVWAAGTSPGPDTLPRARYECPDDVLVDVGFDGARNQRSFSASGRVHEMNPGSEEVLWRTDLPTELAAELQRRQDVFVWKVDAMREYAVRD